MNSGALYTRRGLALFLILLLYDGALRKWLLPEAEQLAFVTKDILLATMIGGVLFLSGKNLGNTRLQPTVLTFLFMYFIWCCLQVFNPNLPNILVGIWGLKSHVLYMGLILLLPLAFKSLGDLFNTLKNIYPWMVIPIAVIALMQIGSSADIVLNQSIRGTDSTAYLGESELVRVTGTFSYISGMTSFLQGSVMLGIGLFFAGARSLSFIVAFFLAIACLPASGSRALLVVTFSSAGIMVFTALISRLANFHQVIRISVWLVALGIISLLAQDDVWVAMQERIISSRYDEDRFLTAFTNAFSYFDDAGVFGFGTGATNLGVLAFVGDATPFYWLPQRDYFEEESGRIVLELGIVGWIFSMALRLALLFWSWSLTKNARTHSVRLAAVLALPVMAHGVYVGNGVFLAPVGACYYWFCVAILSMAHYEHNNSKHNPPSNSSRYL